MNKNAANVITVFRIIFTVLLLFLTTFSADFYIVYVLCGLTDLLDGFIARKFHIESELGARLDSFADVFFLAVTVIKVYPYLSISTYLYVWAFIVIFIKLLSLMVVELKYKKLALLHTYSVKACGVIMFVLLIFIKLLGDDLTVAIALVACTISSLEELIINISSKELDLNRKWLFDKRG